MIVAKVGNRRIQDKR